MLNLEIYLPGYTDSSDLNVEIMVNNLLFNRSTSKERNLCEHCDQETFKLLTETVCIFPKLLIVELGRFQPFINGESKKNNCKVKFRQSLKIKNPHVQNSSTVNYQLVGIVVTLNLLILESY